MIGWLGLLWFVKIMEKLVKILMSFLETRWMIKSTPFFLCKCTYFIPFFIQEVDIMSMLPNVRCIL